MTVVDHATAGEAMVRFPKTCASSTTVHQAWETFRDGHVHALLVVEAGRLLTVIERADLVGWPGDAPVRPLGTTRGRTVAPGAALAAVREGMRAAGRRRLAVVDGRGRLLGLLCLKRSGRGFCSDAGVAARAAERRAARDHHIGATRA